MSRYRASLVTVACLLVQACVSLPGVGKVPVRSPGLAAKTLTGTVTLEATLAITPHRGLLAVVNPWAATDIDHVRLELFQGATSKGTLTVTQAQLANVVRINNLVRNTSYTIQARAWQDAGETVPIDNFDVSAATCTTTFSTTSDDVLSLAGGIALRLRDRNFSGLGTGAIAVTPGSLVASGAEGLALVFNAGVVTTLAGSTNGYFDGTGAAAQFSQPSGVAADSSGYVYVADYLNHRIRKISPAGVVTTLAGSTNGYADGTGTAAQFSYPTDVVVDAGGYVYVADNGNSRIRKVSPAGVVTTLAGSTAGYQDGVGAAARFSYPWAVALDGTGQVFVTDEGNHCIRQVTSAGVVTTIAGSGVGYADGTGAAAQFANPKGLAIDPSGNLYVADAINNRIRKVTPSGVVSTLAGSTVGFADGTGSAAQFSQPYGVAADVTGNLFVADYNNSRIRKVTSTGVVTTLAGDTSAYLDGTGTAARFSAPRDITMDATGKLFVADFGNHRIRVVQ